MPFESAQKPPPPQSKALQRALYTRKVYGVLALFGFLFAGVNVGDGRPLQMPAALVCMATTLLFLVSVLWVWSVRMNSAAKQHRKER